MLMSAYYTEKIPPPAAGAAPNPAACLAATYTHAHNHRQHISKSGTAALVTPPGRVAAAFVPSSVSQRDQIDDPSAAPTHRAEDAAPRMNAAATTSAPPGRLWLCPAVPDSCSDTGVCACPRGVGVGVGVAGEGVVGVALARGGGVVPAAGVGAGAAPPAVNSGTLASTHDTELGVGAPPPTPPFPRHSFRFSRYFASASFSAGGVLSYALYSWYGSGWPVRRPSRSYSSKPVSISTYKRLYREEMTRRALRCCGAAGGGRGAVRWRDGRRRR